MKKTFTTIFLNNGSGGFIEKDNAFDFGISESHAVFISDIDNDILSYSSTYLNSGEGIFEKESIHSFINVSNAAILDIYIDHDGDPDIVLSGVTRANVVGSKLYVNDGFGNFTEWIDFPVAALINGTVVKGDLDGDNDMDLITAGGGLFNNQIRIYENHTCWPAPQNAISFDGTSITVPEGDFNYQWIKCDENDLILEGKTDPVFYPFAVGTYAAIISNRNCKLISDCVEFTEDDLDNVQSRLYSNPASEFLTIEAKQEELSTLQLYNSLGKEMNGFVKFSSTKPNTVQINVSELSTGIYFLKTNNDVLRFFKL